MAVLFKNLVLGRGPSYKRMSATEDIECSPTQAFLSADRHSVDSSAFDATEEHEKAGTGSNGDDSHDGAASDAGSDTSSSTESSTDPVSSFRAHIISNFTIGFSDGLTVPFAVTAGLSALGKPRVVIFGGLSELVAGTISMGMGGYLGAKGEADAYAATLQATHTTVTTDPERTSALISKTLAAAHLPPSLIRPAQEHLLSRPSDCADFLMRFHHQLPSSSFPWHYALLSGAATSLGYVSGGIVPLLPYLFMPSIHSAFLLSIVVTACVLLAFGWAKTWVVIGKADWKACARGSAEMFCLGGFAAAAAVGCVQAFS